MEQEEYTKEEIDWSYIEFVDNQDILDLIEKKPGGIIALLDEACMLPRSTHETFAEKLYQGFKNHKRISKPKLSRSDFTIHHYAGDVTYQTELFLDKNKDYVVAEHQALLNASKCSFVSSLFPPLSEDSSKSSKFSSIGSRFKQQLQQLLETLSATEPHYIRCVKPNNLLKPAIFENSNILQQLRCGGVMEAIRISCAGYPTRRGFYEFVDRFGILAPGILSGSPDEVTAARRLLEKVDLKGFQIGKTKVFLRAGQMAELDALRNEVLGRSAKVIQRRFRSHLARRNFILLRNSAIQLQAVCRGHLARQLHENLRRQSASLTIQKYSRMYLARKAYMELLSSSCTIQAGLRGMVARKGLLSRRQTRAAILIQCHCRMYLARIQYIRLRKAAITTQCAWRGKIAKRELRMLKMAAKETGALQEAKNKLEKQVEELTWRLQLEKRIRSDMEEAKTQENAKLQSALQEVQQQYNETKTLLIKEQEAAKKASEEGPIIQEVQVVDTTLVDKLKDENEKLKADMEEAKTQENVKLQSALQEMQQQLNETKAMLIKEKEAAKKGFEEAPSVQEVPVMDTTLMDRLNDENEKLKALVNSLEKKIDETEKKYEETSRVSEERLKKALDAESKIIDLNKAMQSLKQKVTSMESEDKILRQKALLHSPANRMSGYLSIPSTPTKHSLENGHHAFDGVKESHSAPPSIFAKSDSKLRRSYIERQHENVDALIHCVNQNIGFSQGKPIAAFTIYKCLLHWKSFEAEKTSVFDRLIQMIGSAIENEESNDYLAYWLSSTSTLLFLLQKSLKASTSGGTPGKPPPPISLFGRMTQGFRSSSANLSVDGLDIVQKVEAKYPALLFKQQLTAYVEKIYGIIRDNVKKEMSSMFPSCIQAPRKWAAVRGAGRSLGSPTRSNPWDGIIESLNILLKIFRENYVPPVLFQKIITQIFSFINVQLFNSLLLRRECCSFSNGEYMKSGLDNLELWCGHTKSEYPGLSCDELTHIRQAVGFLVIFQKYRISYDDIVNDLCPILSVQQLYRICTQYWDDKYNTQSVSPSVLSSMKELTEENSENPEGNSFLLDDNSSIPFSVDDITSSLQLKDFANMKHAAELLENPAFQFLQE